MLDLESVKIFIDVVEYGSFSQAADKLFISKSMIKKRMDQLEAYIGAPLLKRGPKGIELTPAGLVFLERASTIFRSIEAMKTECSKAAHATEKRVIRVAYYSDFVFPSIQYCCDHYAEKHPSDVILPVFTKFNNARNGIRNGLYDIAICPKADIDDSGGIATSPLYKNRMGAMVLKGSELAKKSFLSRKDLSENEVVVHPMWCPKSEIEAWSKKGDITFDVEMNDGGADAMQSVCARGGIYLYPESDYSQFPYTFLPLEDPIMSWATVVYSTAPSPIVLDFAKEAISYYKSLIDATNMLLLVDWSTRPASAGNEGT